MSCLFIKCQRQLKQKKIRNELFIIERRQIFFLRLLMSFDIEEHAIDCLALDQENHMYK